MKQPCSHGSYWLDCIECAKATKLRNGWHTSTPGSRLYEWDRQLYEWDRQQLREQRELIERAKSLPLHLKAQLRRELA